MILQASLCLAMAQSAFAADRFWYGNTGCVEGGGGSGQWGGTSGTGISWKTVDDGVCGGQIAWINANGDDAIFGGTGGTVSVRNISTAGNSHTINRIHVKAGDYIFVAYNENAGNQLITSGRFTVDANCTADINVAATIRALRFSTPTGQPLILDGAGTFRFQNTNNRLLVNGIHITGGGTYDCTIGTADRGWGIAPAEFVADFLMISNNSTLQISTTTSPGVNRGVTIGNGGGRIQASSANTISALITGSSTLTKLGNSTLTVSADNTATFTGPLKVSAGTLALSVNGSFAGSPTITLDSGATLNASVRTDGTLAIGGSQKLTGAGTVTGIVSLTGTVAPGSEGVGTLNLTGNQTWNPGGAYEFEFASTTGVAGTDWDRLNITGNLDIQATDEVTFTIKVATPGDDASNFDNDEAAAWTISSVSGTVDNYAANKFAVNYADVSNDLAGGTFVMDEIPLTVKFVPNQAPTASNPTLERGAGAPGQIQIVQLGSDPDGDGILIVNFAETTPEGATVSSDGTYLYYTPGPNGNVGDTISYTIRDARSYRAGDTFRTASGTIAVTVGAGSGPVITQQPGSQTLNYGATATFTVAAGGAGELTYQWQKNNVNIEDEEGKISGVTTLSLAIANVTASDAGAYKVLVTDDDGTTPSSTATLTVNDPAITQQPEGQTVAAGANVNFSVTAIGGGTLGYQWTKGGNDIFGATTSAFNLSNVSQADAGMYAVVVTGASIVTSQGAVLIVIDPPSLSGLANSTKDYNTTATFTVVASGVGPFTYQWKKGIESLSNGGKISSATGATLNIANVTYQEAGSYTVDVTNGGGTTSASASLTVNDPIITTQPVSQSKKVGHSVTFSVVAAGSETLGYQWRLEGTDIASATGSSYTLNSVQLSDAGEYSVVVSHIGGSVTSEDATLTVIVPLPAGDRFWAANSINAGGAGAWNTTAEKWGLDSAGPFDVVWDNENLDSAVFVGDGVQPGAISIDAPVTVNKIIVTNANATPGYSFTGTIPITFAGEDAKIHIHGPATPQDNNTSATNTVAVTAPLSGPVLIKDGPGRMNVNNTGNSVGKWIIKGGSVTVNGANNSANRIFGSGVPAEPMTDFITMDGGGVGFQAAGSFAVGVNRGIYLGEGGGMLGNSDGAGVITIDGPITGPGSLYFPSFASWPGRVQGANSTFIISNQDNNFEGNIFVETCTITLGNDQVFPATATLFLGDGGALNGHLNLNGFHQTIAKLVIESTGNSRVRDSIGGGSLSASEFDLRRASVAQTTTAPLAGSGFLRKTTSGQINLSGVNTYSGDTLIEEGVLALTGSGSFDYSPNIYIAADATLSVTGRTDGTLHLGSAQTLSGSGSLVGALSVNGTLAPGTSIGELSSGSLTWNSGAIYEWETASVTGTAGEDWDHLNITGNLDIQATVENRFIIQIKAPSEGFENFDNNVAAEWVIASVSGSVLNFAADKFDVDYSAVINNLAGGIFTVALEAGSLKVKFIPNGAPVASSPTVARVSGQPVSIAIANLASDPDNDAIELVNFSETTAEGATVSVDGSNLVYTPGANGDVPDSISYTVRDARAYRIGDTVRTASGTATIVIEFAPSVVISPNPATVPLGGSVTFTAGVTGTEPLTFQWSFNGLPINGAITSIYSITGVYSDQQGTYTCDVSNSAGNASADAELTITNSASDIAPPLVKLLSPLPKAIVTEGPLVTLKGSATDDVQAARVTLVLNGVSYLVDVTLPDPAKPKIGAWETTLEVLVGTNTLTLQAEDYTGKKSAVLSTFFVYGVPEPFTLEVVGSGTVAMKLPKLLLGTGPNNITLNIAQNYQLTAIAPPGQVFSNYYRVDTEQEVSTDLIYAFVMETNLQLRANFIENPYNQFAGVYHGLFFNPADVVHDQSGYLQMKVKPASTPKINGATFSAKLLIDGNAASASGKFDLNGRATVTVSRAKFGKDPLTLTLRLPVGEEAASVPGDQILGTVSEGEAWTASLQGDRATWSLTNTTDMANAYTLAISGAENKEDGPTGFGGAAVSVVNIGKVKVSGKNGDGSNLKAGTFLSKEGYIPVYSPAYIRERMHEGKNLKEAHGSVIGWVQLLPNTNSLNPENLAPLGIVHWNKLVASPVETEGYPSAFNITSDILGSLQGTPVLKVLNLTEATATLSGGNLIEPLSADGPYNEKNALAIEKALNTQLQLKLGVNIKTGLMKGSFRHPGNPEIATKFTGVALADYNIGLGSFMDAGVSGVVELGAMLPPEPSVE